MKNKCEINDLAERELLRVQADAEDLIACIQDTNRPIISRLIQVQLHLHRLHTRSIVLAELRGQLVLLNNK